VPPDALAEALRADFAELREADAKANHDIAVGQDKSHSRVLRADLAAVTGSSAT
jgi:hypothetical protein